VTFGRLLLAWLFVAGWFYVATWLTALVPLLLAPRSGGAGWFVSIPLWMLRWRPVEAGLLTLLASLWFDSLGSGGWWLVFGLVGLLATLPPLLHDRSAAPPRRAALLAWGAADVARYLVAGALLAWRLA
jgi:hypothetical protein